MTEQEPTHTDWEWVKEVLAVKERAATLELVPSQDVEFLLGELTRYKRGAKTLGEIIEKQCREVLDVTGLHHLINEDGDGHWDVVWMRLHEMREELADLKESTIGRERLRGDAWRDRAQSLEVELQAAGYGKSSDRRPSVVTDAANRVAYFLNWHQGDNDITADFPSGPSLYASDLQVILNELKAGGASEPRETVIRDSSGHILDRWVDSDDDDPCCDECRAWAAGTDVDEQAKRAALQDAINAAHERMQWAQQGVFMKKRDACPPHIKGGKPHCPDCSGIVGETGIVW